MQPSLETVDSFLKKREGIDKTLKIIRYTSRFLLATTLRGDDSELAQRLKRFESSIATSRKAYRLGKFLGGVNTLRRTRLHGPYGALEWLAAGGDTVYYFTEQLTWLVKAGLLPDRLAPRFSRVSAWGEFVSYLGSITLSLLRISLLLEREAALRAELQRQQAKQAVAAATGVAQTRRQVQQQGGMVLAVSTAAGGGLLLPAAAGDDDDGGGSAKALATEIRLLRAQRYLRTRGLMQDLADLLMVLPDIRSSSGKPRGVLEHPATLALAGLVSGCLGAYKNWPGR